MKKVYVVGSGPNGMAAAVYMSEKGYDVTVFEASNTPGGGSRSASLTKGGFIHDICSAVHPMAFVSPYFKELGMSKELDFIIPELSFAQPITKTESAYAYRDIAKTAEGLGIDEQRWLNIFSNFSNDPYKMGELFLKPLIDTSKLKVVSPALNFGINSLLQSVDKGVFKGVEARALISGVAAHTNVKLPSVTSSFVGMSLTGLSQSSGWPIIRGGSQQIINFLQKKLEFNNGKVICDVVITDKSQLADADIVFFDTSVRDFVNIFEYKLPSSSVNTLKKFKYGNAVAKLDLAMSGPIPWNDKELHKAGTVHVGGEASEVVLAENTVAKGKTPNKPYILVSQPSTFDDSRAPKGYDTAWLYTHVPASYNEDPTDLILNRVEKFAPGIRDLIIDSHTMNAVQYEEYNRNYVGGDISSGDNSLSQFFSRPKFSFTPWDTKIPNVYLCSSSTFPGPGVHGMSGYNAAKLAYKKDRKKC
ncbi:MAG: NAD(P)/FAD-dependent oxidoreductase [Micrococcaceae bacterium]